MILASSSACCFERTRMRNSSFPDFPFHTAYLPPWKTATRTFPVLGGISYSAMENHSTNPGLSSLHRPLQQPAIPPRRYDRNCQQGQENDPVCCASPAHSPRPPASPGSSNESFDAPDDENSSGLEPSGR